MSDEVPQGGEISPWADVLGPLYAVTALVRNGLAGRPDLITITTTDKVTLWPQWQFEVGEDGSIVPREPVVRFWNDHVVPAMQKGIIDDYMAAELFFQKDDDGLSWADKYADETLDPAKRLVLEERITRTLSHMAQ